MSKHWQPETAAVPIRSGSGRGGAVALLACAILLGLGAGIGPVWWNRTDQAVTAKPDAPIDWDGVAAAPKSALSEEDAEWQGRAEALDRPLPAAPAARAARAARGVRASFGFCHVGGGRNCVVDGDTFYIGGAKVRIAGIDAPETHPPRCAAEARLGAAATARLRALLNSGAVSMSASGRNRDKYGRLLRDVAVDGRDVGEAMIGAGVARAYGRGRRGWC